MVNLSLAYTWTNFDQAAGFQLFICSFVSNLRHRKEKQIKANEWMNI